MPRSRRMSTSASEARIPRVSSAGTGGAPAAKSDAKRKGGKGPPAQAVVDERHEDDSSWVLAGAPNSTIAPVYAAQQLLRLLGVRFLAWDETLLPTDSPALPEVDMTFEPRFEYRDVDGWAALSDPQQAQYFHLNGAAQSRQEGATVSTDAPALGRAEGPPAAAKHKSPYAQPPGFVHTSYSMLYDSGPNGGWPAIWIRLKPIVRRCWREPPKPPKRSACWRSAGPSAGRSRLPGRPSSRREALRLTVRSSPCIFRS